MEKVKRLSLALVISGAIIFAHKFYKKQGHRPYQFSGTTMGTTYTVKLLTTGLFSQKKVKEEVEKILEEINRQMSTYRQDSEITAFNEFEGVQPFKVSVDFYKVVSSAKKFFTLTWGLFDPTVSPLVNLWGFGHVERSEKLPNPTQILEAKKTMGLDKITLGKDYVLVKKDPKVTLNLSAIAKGYAVDEVAWHLTQYSENFLVEIGGEVKTVGYKDPFKKTKWRVGVEKPNYENQTELHKSMELKDKCIAGSGDYRNFYKHKGKKISHTINPKTGYPAESGVVAVTVIADYCMDADALATALMVGGENLLFSMPELRGFSGFLLVNKAGKLTEVSF